MLSLKLLRAPPRPSTSGDTGKLSGATTTSTRDMAAWLKNGTQAVDQNQSFEHNFGIFFLNLEMVVVLIFRFQNLILLDFPPDVLFS